MADLRISQLPEVTSLEVADILPVVSLNQTKRITLQTLNNNLPLTTFVRSNSALWIEPALSIAQFSWQNNFVNLTNSSDNFVRWDSTELNTDVANFQLFNAGTSAARILVKKEGFYELSFSAVCFDLWGDVSLTARLQTTSLSAGGSYTAGKAFFGKVFGSPTSSPPAQIVSGQLVSSLSANNYITVSVNPSNRTPFPGTLQNVYTNIYIKKLN